MMMLWEVLHARWGQPLPRTKTLESVNRCPFHTQPHLEGHMLHEVVQLGLVPLFSVQDQFAGVVHGAELRIPAARMAVPGLSQGEGMASASNAFVCTMLPWASKNCCARNRAFTMSN
jgi:hypothetical protein